MAGNKKRPSHKKSPRKSSAKSAVKRAAAARRTASSRKKTRGTVAAKRTSAVRREGSPVKKASAKKPSSRRKAARETLINIDDGCVVDLHEAHCSKRNGDWVRWVNRMNEAAIIRFTGDSPFPGPHPIQIEVGSHHRTNPVIAAEGSYEYTIACAGAVMDPVIVIDP